MQINGIIKSGLFLSGVLAAFVAGWTHADGWQYDGLTTKAPNTGSIANTRHNLTMSYLDSGTLSSTMDLSRNNYFEVCVYCHTPHGANSRVGAPLWNRTVSNRTYQLFADRVEDPDTGSGNAAAGQLKAATLAGQPYTQPGPNSLTCLSCHDGATAIDSIINMPTTLTAAGRRAGWNPGAEIYEEMNVTTWDQNLDDWNTNNLGTPATDNHAGFNSGTGACLSCHTGAPGPDFRILVIGQNFATTAGINDLTDDHPIGVRFPMGEAAQAFDYNEPDVRAGRIAYWDNNGNQHADPNEIRVYDTGDGYEVECGSCHDPHGVAVAGQTGSPNAQLTPSFLRVGTISGGEGGYSVAGLAMAGQAMGNPGSQLCLTCHVK